MFDGNIDQISAQLDFAYKKCEHFSLQVIITHT